MLYAVQLSRLGDDEKSPELRGADPDKFVAFEFRDLIQAGRHSRPVDFRELAAKAPGALIV